ncbi:MAG: hypothetical protein MRY83_03410, partial [Flavobacteriales bacterium]|nr:hypothetical protein [Flavobacteriales bacterium]
PANKLGIVINGSFIGFKQEKLRTAILIVNQFNWVGDLPQFIFKGNAKKSVIAIEESEVLVLPHSFHEHMMKNDEQYQDIFLKQLAHSIDNYEERLEVLQTGSVSDKIKYLKEKFPKLFSHGKLKYLANFLDISQEAFSRNLKKIEDS